MVIGEGWGTECQYLNTELENGPMKWTMGNIKRAHFDGRSSLPLEPDCFAVIVGVKANIDLVFLVAGGSEITYETWPVWGPVDLNWGRDRRGEQASVSAGQRREESKLWTLCRKLEQCCDRRVGGFEGFHYSFLLFNLFLFLFLGARRIFFFFFLFYF